MNDYLLVAGGAVVGAPLRYLTDRFVQSRHRTRFPYGTFVVNVVGCLVLGVLTGFALSGSDPWQLVIGTGFCGALTTYSTFSFETWRLIEQRATWTAVANVVISIGVGLGAATIGYALTRAWSA